MWILGLVFVVVGAPFVWLARRTFARDAKISRWPTTEGVVTMAGLRESSERYEESTGLYQYRTVYTPLVVYTYSVAGQAYEGRSIARTLDDVRMMRDSAQKWIDKYPSKKQVRVLYDPANPQTAHLESLRAVGAVILLIFGMVWVGIGTFLVVLGIS